jgi:hypothetical protein
MNEAEEEGFEPPWHCCPSVFKTAPFGHSGTPPNSPSIRSSPGRLQFARPIQTRPISPYPRVSADPIRPSIAFISIERISVSVRYMKASE